MDEDGQLLEQWRAGVDAAGQKLFRRHFTSVHRFFSYKVGDDDDELAQASFLAAVESRERISTSFRGYLFGVARKQLLRFFEGRGRGLPADALSVRSVVDLAPTPSRVIVKNQDLAALVTAMQHIPVDCQVALELYYWEEMSTAEIGEALGSSQV
ncbi:MAG: sigma-70 family RNA polymerase sigma factor [Myxococcota bacterium]